MKSRKLGKSGLRVSALGLGCWAIGGDLWYMDKGIRHPLSWGNVNDQDSIQAIQQAIEIGVNYFDTANSYGSGHSEKILGKAIEGRREKVIISTKFGDIFEEETRRWLGHNHPDGVVTPGFVKNALDASLKQLNTDYIDLYFFHWKEYDVTLAADLMQVLEGLVDENKIRHYGWSTPYTEQASVFMRSKHSTATQYNYNIFERNPDMLALCEESNHASIARGPFAMGLLTGKYTVDSKLPENDVRGSWDLGSGRFSQQLKMLEAIREVLTRDGRTLPQAALGWLWALSPQVVPIPGFKTVKQVVENVKAIEFGPLKKSQMKEIDRVLESFDYDFVVLD